jgi:hypothetical protein
MDALLTLFAITAILALLGLAAATVGVDTRDGLGADGSHVSHDAATRGIA